jgi:hypothetical protein
MLDLASQSFRYAGSAILRATSLVSEDATNREVHKGLSNNIETRASICSVIKIINLEI